MSQPIVFAAPADAELTASPIYPAWITEGTPQAHSKRVAQSADGTAAVFVWSCTAGRFTWHYAGDELAHILSGEVFVTDHHGNERRFGPGDMAFFPAGSRSHWHVPQHVKKLAMCRHGMPRAFGFVLRVWNRAVRYAGRFSAGGGAPHVGLGPAQALRGIIDKPAGAP
jgi:uncharacterized cupin superfamily protein